MITIILLVTSIFILIIHISDLRQEIENLQQQNAILRTENRSLKRVLIENDLLPKKFAKGDRKK